MAEITTRRGRHCTLFYEEGFDGDVEYSRVVRCVPDKGYYLFEIKASYTKHKPATSYYRVGATPKDVKGNFLRTMTWMNIKSVRLIPPGPEAKEILTDPLRMPL